MYQDTDLPDRSCRNDQGRSMNKPLITIVCGSRFSFSDWSMILFGCNHTIDRSSLIVHRERSRTIVGETVINIFFSVS